MIKFQKPLAIKSKKITAKFDSTEEIIRCAKFIVKHYEKSKRGTACMKSVMLLATQQYGFAIAESARMALERNLKNKK